MFKKRILAISLLAACGMIWSCSDDSTEENEKPVSCSSEKDCPNDEICQAGSCVEAPCTGADCEEPKKECVDDSGCKDGKICQAGSCVESPCTGADCEPSEKECVDDSGCKDGKICQAGSCVEAPCTGADCEPSEKECVDDSGCKDGKVCQAGSCVHAPCTGTDCEPSEKECVDDSGCKDGEICQSGSCVHAPCTGADCEPSEKECASDSDCKDGKICNADGQCEIKESGIKDTDGDGISDEFDRCDEDTDGDSIPNCEDLDSDGDGIPDSVEAENDGDLTVEPIDSDNDGIYDFKDTDSDDNGILDHDEAGGDPEHPVDTNGDGVSDFMDYDNDGDGILDFEEIAGGEVFTSSGERHTGRRCGENWCEMGTPDNPWDSDGDTIPDYMDLDSDGDGIADRIEGSLDSDGDGVLDRYSLDSDGDGLLDSKELDENGEPLKFAKSDGSSVYCYRVKDCDGDSLRDSQEVYCVGIVSMVTVDSDGDGYQDGAEYTAAKYAMVNGTLSGEKIHSVAELICNKDRGVKDVFEFYFELPYGAAETKDDELVFKPSVQKLDVVFNVDTTQSMERAINNVKTNIVKTIEELRKKVKDSGVGLTNFDDYPVSTYGSSSDGDQPFRLIGAVSTDDEVISGYTKSEEFKLRNGGDTPESGTESLYQIATGEGLKWLDGSVPARVNAAETWGGVDWRKDTLPVVVHTTDAISHDQNGEYLKSFTAGKDCPEIEDAHYTDDMMPKLKEKGIRVITLNVNKDGGAFLADREGQMTLWARETGAVVPVCAFSGVEGCPEGMCCLGAENSKPIKVGDRTNQCVLAYKSSQDDVSAMVVSGVDALIKYGTYEVATRVIGEPIPGSDVSTECFIEAVEAFKYEAPEAEPEKTCNPVAVPTKVGETAYNNGFKNFAPGTSSTDREGAKLVFKVKARNKDCVEEKNEAQVFSANIEVYNPTTGLSFGTRKVSIIVPSSSGEAVN